MSVHRNHRWPDDVWAFLSAKPSGTRQVWLNAVVRSQMRNEASEQEQKRLNLAHKQKQREALDAEIRLLQADLDGFDEEQASAETQHEREVKRVAKFLAQDHTLAEQRHWARACSIPWERFVELKAEVQRGQ